MNPNKKQSNYFDTDKEYAQLWNDIEEEFKKIKSEVERTPKQEKRFRPPTLPTTENIITDPGPEVPSFIQREKRHQSTSNDSDYRVNTRQMDNHESLYIPKNQIRIDNQDNDSLLIPEYKSQKRRQLTDDDIKYLDELTGYSSPERKFNAVQNKELAQKTGNKTIKTIEKARRILVNLNSILSNSPDKSYSRTNDSYGLTKSRMDEKNKIFEQKVNNNKRTALAIGKKGVAVLLSVLTIGSTATALAHQKRARNTTSAITTSGEEYEKTQDQEAEEVFDGKAEIREYTDEDTGEKQIEILLQNPTLVEQSESQNDESVISADHTTESPEIDTNTNEETTVYYEEKIATGTSTESSSDVIDKSTELTTTVDHEIENDSEIKDDMGLSINLTDYMKDELKFIKDTYRKNKETYQKIVEKIKEDMGIDIPTEAICAIHYRESRCDFDSYLQNGDPLGQVTTHVPKGLYFDNFFESAVEAIESQLKAYQDYDKVDFHSMKGLCKFANRYNGFGSQQYHGLPSSYVYTGTSNYQGGMYVEDGTFNENKEDPRMGTYSIIAKLANLA